MPPIIKTSHLDHTLVFYAVIVAQVTLEKAFAIEFPVTRADSVDSHFTTVPDAVLSILMPSPLKNAVKRFKATSKRADKSRNFERRITSGRIRVELPFFIGFRDNSESNLLHMAANMPTTLNCVPLRKCFLAKRTAHRACQSCIHHVMPVFVGFEDSPGVVLSLRKGTFRISTYIWSQVIHDMFSGLKALKGSEELEVCTYCQSRRRLT